MTKRSKVADADSQAAKLAERESAARGAIELVSAADLAAMTLREPRWAVPGLVPEGVTLLAGPPKTGKSWLALGISYAVASGGCALGSVRVEAGEALYGGLEDTRRRLQSRLRTIAAGGPAPSKLFLATSLPRLDAAGLEVLRSTLRSRPELRLVVLDTLARVRPDRKANGDIYAADAALIASLQAVAVEAHVALLALTHTRKVNTKNDDDPLETVTGTLGLTGAADAVLVLRRGRFAQTATLALTGRDIEERQLGLRFDPQGGTWVLVGDAAEVVESEARQAIIASLRGAGRPLTVREVADDTGRKYGNVKFLVSRMVQAGTVVRFGPGTYTLPAISAISLPVLSSPLHTHDSEGSGDSRDSRVEAPLPLRPRDPGDDDEAVPGERVS